MLYVLSVLRDDQASIGGRFAVKEARRLAPTRLRDAIHTEKTVFDLLSITSRAPVDLAIPLQVHGQAPLPQLVEFVARVVVVFELCPTVHQLHALV